MIRPRSKNLRAKMPTPDGEPELIDPALVPHLLAQDLDQSLTSRIGCSWVTAYVRPQVRPVELGSAQLIPEETDRYADQRRERLEAPALGSSSLREILAPHVVTHTHSQSAGSPQRITPASASPNAANITYLQFLARANTSSSLKLPGGVVRDEEGGAGEHRSRYRPIWRTRPWSATERRACRPSCTAGDTAVVSFSPCTNQRDKHHFRS